MLRFDGVKDDYKVNFGLDLRDTAVAMAGFYFYLGCIAVAMAGFYFYLGYIGVAMAGFCFYFGCVGVETMLDLLDCIVLD